MSAIPLQHGVFMAPYHAGFDVLGENWQVAKEVAAEHGRGMDPRRLRLGAPMHIAETREQARADVARGLERWCEYFDRVAPKGLGGLLDRGDPVDLLIDAGRAAIGTPEDAIAMIEKLQGKQGEFGVILLQAHDWAGWEALQAERQKGVDLAFQKWNDRAKPRR